MKNKGSMVVRAGVVSALVLVAFVWPVNHGVAQTEFSGLPELGAPVFAADVVAFHSANSNLATLEIYYKITNINLTYVRQEDKYFASYEIDAVLRGHGNPQVASTSVSESYSVPDYQATRSEEGYLLNKILLEAPSGEYKLKLKLRDRISHRTYERELEIKVPKFQSGSYSISSPLFTQAAADDAVPERFKKYGQAMLPRVTRSYGGQQENVPIYLEVYGAGDTTVELSLVARTFHRFQDYTREDTVQFHPELGGRTPVIVIIPLLDLIPGDCEVTFRLANGSDVLAEGEKAAFRVEWSLLSMIRNNWEMVVDQLVHITNHREQRALRDALPEKRVEMFEAFWKSKDPTPETTENEWRDEYYRRIRFADGQYTNPYKRGWRTDFGMVYIKYGAPDQVERYPFELGQKPYEVWYYYAQGRRFIFVDSKGNDDYELQYPFDGLNR